MNRVAIMGLGLMGGSLGLALKARGFEGEVTAYARRKETGAIALEMKAVDQVYLAPHKAVENADVIVFCVPILAIPELITASRRGLRHRCVLTDVGSTKAELNRRIQPLLQGTGSSYVGSHPIAGSEQQGISAARADLYEGAVVVISPGRETPVVTQNVLTDFWHSVGGVVRVMTPEEHDDIMARTSHLPHVISAVLANAVGRDDARRIADYCGTGFFDTSRIAEGSPDVWHDIIQSNRHSIEQELSAYRSELEKMIELVAKGDSQGILDLLSEAQARRRELVARRQDGETEGAV